MPKKNIAVIGSGYWGKNLVRNFHSLGGLGLICDKDEADHALMKGNPARQGGWMHACGKRWQKGRSDTACKAARRTEAMGLEETGK